MADPSTEFSSSKLSFTPLPQLCLVFFDPLFVMRSIDVPAPGFMILPDTLKNTSLLSDSFHRINTGLFPILRIEVNIGACDAAPQFGWISPVPMLTPESCPENRARWSAQYLWLNPTYCCGSITISRPGFSSNPLSPRGMSFHLPFLRS